MAQPVYPTLSRLPETDSFEKAPATDPTNRTTLTDGAYLVQAKLTRVPWTWSFRYRFLTAADLATLMAFYAGDANFGAVPVKWTDPSNDTTYFVHFAGQPHGQMEADGESWRIEVQLVEAIGTYS